VQIYLSNSTDLQTLETKILSIPYQGGQFSLADAIGLLETHVLSSSTGYRSGSTKIFFLLASNSTLSAAALQNLSAPLHAIAEVWAFGIGTSGSIYQDLNYLATPVNLTYSHQGYLLPTATSLTSLSLARQVAFNMSGPYCTRVPKVIVLEWGFSTAGAVTTITYGDEITWCLCVDQFVPHTITSRTSGLFNSGILSYQSNFTVTFSTTGTYQYFCQLHPFMLGTVIVNPFTGYTSIPMRRSIVEDSQSESANEAHAGLRLPSYTVVKSQQQAPNSSLAATFGMWHSMRRTFVITACNFILLQLTIDR
jgi:plastocyanin